MQQNIKVGLLIWILGVVFLFWIQPFYMLLFSVFMLGLGVLAYVLKNRGRK